MKNWLIQRGAFLVVSLSLVWLGARGGDLPWGQLVLACVAVVGLFYALFIPRYPKADALRQAMRLRAGQRIEVEGR